MPVLSKVSIFDIGIPDWLACFIVKWALRFRGYPVDKVWIKRHAIQKEVVIEEHV